MNQEITIRKAGRSDCEAVFLLARAMATSYQVEKNEFSRSFVEILEDHAAMCLVVLKNERTVGYLLGFDHWAFYANGRVSWVEEIYVTEELRKEGIGKKLMEAFEEWCMERGSRLVGLATRRASAFYHAIGYEESAIFFRKLLDKKTI